MKRKVEMISPKAGYTGFISKKTMRNEKCKCGSGKKAKKCCATETRYYSRQIDGKTIEQRKQEDLNTKL